MIRMRMRMRMMGEEEEEEEEVQKSRLWTGAELVNDLFHFDLDCMLTLAQACSRVKECYLFCMVAELARPHGRLPSSHRAGHR